MRNANNNAAPNSTTGTALGSSDTQIIEGLMQRNAELVTVNELNRSIIGNINQALMVIDSSARIALSNQRFRDIFGIDGDGEAGRPLSDVFSNDRVTSVIRQVVETGEAIHEIEVDFTSAYGEDRNFLVSVSKIESSPDENILVTFDEVTEWKRRQKQVMEASRLVSIGEMATGIAHEVNNPLAALMGFSQLAMRRDLDDAARADIEKILAEAKRASKIISNLQSFARRYKPKKDRVDIIDIVQKVLEFRAYELQVNNVDVVTKFDPQTPQVMGDEHQLEQVFLNIVINAEYFMADANHGGTLAIEIGAVNDRVRLSFEDNGPGIKEQNLSKIFDPFFTTKEVGKGTGLGLSICYGIVHEHDGTITVNSTPGKGSTFVIELPIASDAPMDMPIEPIEESANKPKGGSVLIVEDEASVAGFIEQALKEDGYIVDTSQKDENVLQSKDFTDYDVIILDMKMPGVDGADLFNHIKQLPGGVESRVLFITGDTTNHNTSKFINDTGNPLLTKPFSLEKLLSAVGRVAASRSGSTAT